MPLDLTPDEMNLVRRLASQHKRPKYVFFFVSIMITPLVLWALGLAKQDYISIAIAFFGLLVITLWLIFGSVKNGRILSSISAKILDEQNQSGP